MDDRHISPDSSDDKLLPNEPTALPNEPPTLPPEPPAVPNELFIETPNPNDSSEYWRQSSVSSRDFSFSSEPLSSQTTFRRSFPPPPPASPSSIPYRRRISFLSLGLIFLVGVLIIPWLAEETVYSLNRGAERAKAEIARQLLAELPEPERRIPWVAKVVAPCVVGIRTLATIGEDGIGMDVGSGVIVDSQGYILTNQHVVANARAIMVRLNDGRVIEAKPIGQDQATDLAILKVRETNLDAITWGDSRQIEVGDQVVAIGNPYNLEQTVTSGIISATERYNPIPSRRWIHQAFLQTDAAINPGNSGGALVNLKGELIGINTAIFSETGGNMGIGFAIPSFLAKKVYEEILKYGEMKHGWLGLYMAPSPNLQANSPRGVTVTGFLPQSPARDAGLRIGDIILRWNETDINDPLQLSHLVVLSRPGEKATVEIVRNDKTIKIDIILGVRPVEL
ncbi:MAG: trypsin-like peptidase domain-containing protein [Planctomycetaceae bacterium]|jgi:S1-C subfamily serine protease|nr:trypsin-like peptidase domain-containing protein [Planctomycetaceae bacterium]